MFIVFAIVGVYLLIQAVILPRMGVSTWMRPACQLTDQKNETAKDAPSTDKDS